MDFAPCGTVVVEKSLKIGNEYGTVVIACDIEVTIMGYIFLG